MPLQIVEALPGLDVGKGFDALTNDVKVTSAVLGKIGTPEGAAGQVGSFEFTMVKGSSEFREALGISASVSAGVGLFGASAKAKYAERCAVSTQSTVCILSFEARNAFVTFKETPKLDPDLEELLKLDKTQRFRERAGTNFVGGMWDGVLFYGTIRIESGDEARDEEIAASIRASYGPFKASGAIDKETSQRLSHERIEILTFQSGGTVEPVFSLEELFQRAKIVAQQATKGRGVPIAVTLETYDELELPMDDLSEIEQRHARDAIRRLAKHYDAVQDRIQDINYVLRNPDHHEKFNAKKLSTVAQQLTQQLNKIVEHADACGRNPGEFTDFSPTIPQYELPRRIRTRKVRKNRQERLQMQLRSVHAEMALLRQVVGASRPPHSRRALQAQTRIIELQKRATELIAKLNSLEAKKTNKSGANKKTKSKPAKVPA